MDFNHSLMCDNSRRECIMEFEEMKTIVNNYPLIAHIEKQLRIVITTSRGSPLRRTARSDLIENGIWPREPRMSVRWEMIKDILDFFNRCLEPFPAYKKKLIKKIVINCEDILLVSLSEFISESTLRRYIDSFIYKLYIEASKDPSITEKCKKILIILERTTK